MGSGNSPDQTCNERNFGAERTNHPASRKNKPGRRRQPEEPGGIIGNLFLATRNHFFPDFNAWLHDIAEPRDAAKLYYSREHLITQGILMFLTHMKSRRHFGEEASSAQYLANLLQFSGTGEDSIAHPDTMNYFFKNLSLPNLKILFTK